MKSWIDRKLKKLCWVKSLFINVSYLLSQMFKPHWTCCSHCSVVKVCSPQGKHSFFFKSTCKIRWTIVLRILALSTIILQLTRQSFFKTCSTLATFSNIFLFVDPPLLSSSVTNSCHLWIYHAIKMLLHETQLTRPALFECFWCIITEFQIELNRSALI